MMEAEFEIESTTLSNRRRPPEMIGTMEWLPYGGDRDSREPH